MTNRVLIAALCAGAVVAALVAARETVGRRKAAIGLIAFARRWRSAGRELFDEGRIEELHGGRRVLLAGVLVGGVAGFSLLGVGGIPFGMALAPIAAQKTIAVRQRRYGARIDACAAELASALASSLAAGRSLRGALLGASISTPQPLSGEVERAVVGLALGGTVGDMLADLRSRTHSSRIEALAGAIELHRGSGGDLVMLMRELSEAFRERDRAIKDARSASAQARFTAIVVAAIPVFVAGMLELVWPGSVTGALTLLPTAAMLAMALLMIVSGVLLSMRLAAAGQ